MFGPKRNTAERVNERIMQGKVSQRVEGKRFDGNSVKLPRYAAPGFVARRAASSARSWRGDGESAGKWIIRHVNHDIRSTFVRTSADVASVATRKRTWKDAVRTHAGTFDDPIWREGASRARVRKGTRCARSLARSLPSCPFRGVAHSRVAMRKDRTARERRSTCARYLDRDVNRWRSSQYSWRREPPSKCENARERGAASRRANGTARNWSRKCHVIDRGGATGATRFGSSSTGAKTNVACRQWRLL